MKKGHQNILEDDEFKSLKDNNESPIYDMPSDKETSINNSNKFFMNSKEKMPKEYLDGIFLSKLIINLT